MKQKLLFKTPEIKYCNYRFQNIITKAIHGFIYIWIMTTGLTVFVIFELSRDLIQVMLMKNTIIEMTLYL